jgi:hypothetical protein
MLKRDIHDESIQVERKRHPASGSVPVFQRFPRDNRSLDGLQDRAFRDRPRAVIAGAAGLNQARMFNVDSVEGKKEPRLDGPPAIRSRDQAEGLAVTAWQ